MINIYLKIIEKVQSYWVGGGVKIEYKVIDNSGNEAILKASPKYEQILKNGVSIDVNNASIFVTRDHYLEIYIEQTSQVQIIEKVQEKKVQTSQVQIIEKVQKKIKQINDRDEHQNRDGAIKSVFQTNNLQLIDGGIEFLNKPPDYQTSIKIPKQVYVCAEKNFIEEIEVKQVQMVESSFKTIMNNQQQVLELLPHNQIFENPVKLALKVPDEAQHAVLFIQQKTEVDQILDVYEAIPKVIEKGWLYEERRSFSYFFVDVVNSQSNFAIEEIDENKDIQDPSFYMIGVGLSVVHECGKCKDSLTQNFGYMDSFNPILNIEKIPCKGQGCDKILLKKDVKYLVFINAKIIVNYTLEDDNETEGSYQREALGENAIVIGNGTSNDFQKIEFKISQKGKNQDLEKFYIQIDDLTKAIKKVKAKFGKINFTLMWFNGNDLDLHVNCPCGTHIYFSNRSCSECEAHLDYDVNAGGLINYTDPIEHIYLDILKPGKYQYWVHYYAKHDRTEESQYGLSVCNKKRIFQEDSGCLSQSKRMSQTREIEFDSN